MNESRDKFLTEWMGECWHDQRPFSFICHKCCSGKPNIRFNTWEGFGKLWEALSSNEERRYLADALCIGLVPGAAATAWAKAKGWKP